LSRPRIPGSKAVCQAFRGLRSRWSSGVLILGYHRIADSESDPYQLCVSSGHFTEQLAAIRRWAHPLTLAQAVQGLMVGGLPGRSVVVTFDDGYSDTLQVALPLLERFEVPATVFVTSGYLGQTFWWDDLAHWVRRQSHERQTAPLDRSLHQLHEQLVALSAVERAAVLTEWIGGGGGRRDSENLPRCLSPNELIQLDGSALIEMGAHSVTHRRLASASPGEQLQEISQCKEELERVLHHPITSFSYPHGSYAAITQTLMGEAGFQAACCSRPDVARVGSNRFALPRFWPPNCGAERFDDWLARWLPR
jgi:peptidoglycan/xylan/chitin deacetylase (PgdA/CDA1 family)